MMRLASYVVGLALVVSACSATGSTGSTPSPSAGATWSVVAIGDSVPAGTACDCTPYPELSAADLAPPGTPASAAADNDAVAGATTTDVLEQLDTSSSTIADVKAAHLVELEVGANDVAYSSACGTDLSCYQPEVSTVEANLRAIVTKLHDLTAGHGTTLVLLDYWSVWLGGAYAHEQGDAYVDAAATVTDDINTAIRDVAAQTGSEYVDLRAAFKGPDYAYDETKYLAPDGDHPNAAGHRQIAAALVTVVDSPSSSTPG
jgi:acyl-CoA thioesterase I